MNYRNKYPNLTGILDDELDVIEDEEDRSVTVLRAPMRRALDKVKRDKRTLTDLEKDAVRHALEDMGELYLYAGSSSGMKLDDPVEERNARQMGRDARDEARVFGVVMSTT